MAAVAELSKGQLVAMRGVSRGMVMESPVLERCQVAWAGPKNQKQQGAQEAGNEALHAARSLELCMVSMMVAEAERRGKRLPDGGPLTEAALREVEVEGKKGVLARAEETARADLAAAGLSPLPCEHPLIHLAWRCETEAESAGKGSECGVPLVKSVLDKLQR